MEMAEKAQCSVMLSWLKAAGHASFFLQEVTCALLSFSTQHELPDWDAEMLISLGCSLSS